jgi:urease accessory protein
MNATAPPTASTQAPWRAALDLEFAKRGTTTVLAHRRHHGPLALQKALYPEGPAVCHCIVLHPPGGIAGGDELTMRFRAGSGTHALLTTPGASKWYRSEAAPAAQRIDIDVADGACCEWLPQENIFFSGARMSSDVSLCLTGNAVAFGWDINCLGRPAAGERFDSGLLRLALKIEQDGILQWVERARIEGDDRLMASPIGLRGCGVFATAYSAGRECDALLLESLREIAAPPGAEVALTALPRILIARYLGNSAEQARHYFAELWRRLRPIALGRSACSPRIWNT